MKKNKVLSVIFIIFLSVGIFAEFYTDIFYLPIDVENRRILKSKYISSCGDFGIWRKPYKKINGHYHAGIDLSNPGSKKGALEPVYACGNGIVISTIGSGSSSVVIIKHKLRNGDNVYSAYTHISDIVVSVNDTVNEHSVIGSFIDFAKLDKWGEYLNHIHFEILKVMPKNAGMRGANQIYSSYSIDFVNKKMLNEHFYDPKIFFINQ